ncbi:MAG: glycosyltransferase, partial [Ginsengibacter sp.]
MSKNILWLPSWYPDKIKPYNGDFIQRHARAVGMHQPIQVIYIVRDEAGVITHDRRVEDSVFENVNEKIVYYYSPHFLIAFVDSFFSGLKYRRLYRKIISDYIEQIGKPELVHVHIVLKAGLIAKWIKKKYHIPFIISEHWTGYLPDAKEKFLQLPSYLKISWRRIMEKASAVSVVSDYLGSCIKKNYSSLEYKVIPNVVDTKIFKP